MNQSFTQLNFDVTTDFNAYVLQFLATTIRDKILCGGGFMDFIHRPKSKILKN
jgi:hypothetical protein